MPDHIDEEMEHEARMALVSSCSFTAAAHGRPKPTLMLLSLKNAG